MDNVALTVFLFFLGLFCAIMNLMILNKMMKIFDHIDVMTMYQSCVLCCPILFGLILLDEIKNYSVLGVIAVITGCAVCLFGVRMINLKSKANEADSEEKSILRSKDDFILEK